MEDRSVLQNLITDVGQLELAYVPIKEWIIYSDVCGLLDGLWNIAQLPLHYGKIVNTDVITLGITMVIDGEGA